MNKLVRFSLAVLLTVLLGDKAIGENENTSPKMKVSILEKDGSTLIAPGAPPARIGELAKLGLFVTIAGGETRKKLDWDQLKKYNMLVMGDFAVVHGHQKYNPEKLGELLDRYLEEGGGILYIGQAPMDNHRGHLLANQWLKKWGAEIEWKTIDDPENTYNNPPTMPFQRKHIIRTSNIIKNEITRDVNNLYFRNALFYSPNLRPLKVDKNWQVLVSSMPSSETYKLTVPLGAGVVKKIDDTKSKGSVPILAVRKVGKGRLAIIGHNPAPLYFDLGKPALGQICAKNGDGKIPSDWMKLLNNLCLWLSEPARKAKFPGGAKGFSKFSIREDYGTRKPIDWERPAISWADSDIKRLYGVHYFDTLDNWHKMAAGHCKSFKFLVGARTKLSGGKGTVNDWKKAAQAAGYDGVVFREDILNLSPEQWDQFEEECRAASDDNFFAVPGQQFSDWEENKFLRFNREIPYHNKERLTPDGKKVWRQLHFYFDCNKGKKMKDFAGLPANMPLWIKGNKTTPWWAYRVYSAIPVMVYNSDNKLIENNLKEWEQLVYRIEFPTPMAIHLLDDPDQIANAAKEFNLYLLAPSLKNIQTNRVWQRYHMGTGTPNSMSAYMSNGPKIDAFLTIANYRTTLGSREIDGSYRYRLIIRAHSKTPIKTLEIWGGGTCLRRLHPNKKLIFEQIEDIHDRQRGLWIKVVDADGKEAYATGYNVHDKMMYLQWCGDHCNMLPNSTGVNQQGFPSGAGIATHVKLRFDAATGPGSTFADTINYVPYGTDTSSPTLGIRGLLRMHTASGMVPENHQTMAPNVQVRHCNRNVMVTRMNITDFVDRRTYMGKDAPKPYNSGYFSGWGAYFTMNPLQSFEVTHDDIDFQRNTYQPAFQLCRGMITFKKDIKFSDKHVVNLELGRINWKTAMNGLYLSTGPVPRPGNINQKLGKGNYLTFPENMSNGTIFALDDNLAVRGSVKKDGESIFWWGYNLGNREFKAGDTLVYHFLIMRWPGGMNVNEKLDEKVAKALNLQGDSGVKLSAIKGQVERAPDVGFVVKTNNQYFLGKLSKSELSLGIPVRVHGLNGNWSAGYWQKGMKLLAPVAPDSEGVCWLLLDPAKQSGKIFIGNVLTCNNSEILLRLIHRSDGTWEVLTHNPTKSNVTIDVKGTEGGPVSGHQHQAKLNPGQVKRWIVK